MNHTKVVQLQQEKWILSQQQETTQWITMEKFSKQFHQKCIIRVCPKSNCIFSYRDMRRISPHTEACKNGITENHVLAYLSDRLGKILLK